MQMESTAPRYREDVVELDDVRVVMRKRERDSEVHVVHAALPTADPLRASSSYALCISWYLLYLNAALGVPCRRQTMSNRGEDMTGLVFWCVGVLPSLTATPSSCRRPPICRRRVHTPISRDNLSVHGRRSVQ